MNREHKTEPDFYESPLSESASQQRADLERQLERVYAEARHEYNSVLRAKIMRRADAIEAQLSLQGANPKKVPFDTLKEHVQGPNGQDAVVNKYRSRIKNRATAIRAYCVWCMGGELVGVRLCPSVTCPLHPFRMGGDPFRGFDIPKFEMPELDVEVDEEEDAGEFEEGDDGSDTDATL